MQTSMSSVEEEEEECQHFINVCRAFCSYEKEGLREVHRIEKHLTNLSERHRSMLIEDVPAVVNNIKCALKVNQSFIDLLLGEQELDSLYHGDKKWAKGAVAHALEQEEYDNVMEEELCVCDGTGDNGCFFDTCDNVGGGCQQGIDTSNQGPNKHNVESFIEAEPSNNHSFEDVSRMNPNVNLGSRPTTGDAATSVHGTSATAMDSDEQNETYETEANRTCSINDDGNIGNNPTSPPVKSSSLNEHQDHRKPVQPCDNERICGNYGHSHDNNHYHHHVHADPVPLGKDMSKVRSTLRQFVRDWSNEGIAERNSAYGPLLEAMEQYLPITDLLKVPRVLCPGSGLGRLPFEVAKRGYASQGNEFSYYMLLGSNFALNYSLKPYSFPIQPYCLSTSNRRGYKDNLRTIWIPDTCPGDFVSADKEFSMCAGEFIEAPV